MFERLECAGFRSPNAGIKKPGAIAWARWLILSGFISGGLAQAGMAGNEVFSAQPND
jgi:hypothetical protein